MTDAKIDGYIAGLNYDPRVLLSVVPDGTTSSVPQKNRQTGNNGVVICTTIRHTLSKSLSEVAILSPTAGVVFPGALVLADQGLVDGAPTPIGLKRGPVALTLDLPGLADPSGTVAPDNATVQRFLNAKLEEWNTVPVSHGYINAARSFMQITKAYSSQQVALDLGFSAKWASGSASAQIGASSTTEKSVVVAYFKQVFYTVTMNTPEQPSSVFDPSVTLEQVKRIMDDRHPPAYVRSVDYGRILMCKMESSSVDTTLNLTGAFESATSGGATVGGSLKAKYEEIVRNSSFTVLALGGGASTPVAIFNGASAGDLQGLRDYIAGDARYRRDNPGMPIAYTTAFLKDNQFARMGFTTDYTETECVRYNNGFVKLAHAGGYVGRFYVTWREPDGQGNYTVEKSWESGQKTAGYSEQVNLPGDAQSVTIKGQAATGLVWDPWGEIMNVSLSGPDNKCYRAKGTTLNRSWDNDCT